MSEKKTEEQLVAEALREESEALELLPKGETREFDKRRIAWLRERLNALRARA